MFWKKKPVEISPVAVEATGVASTANTPPAAKGKVSKSKTKKLTGPLGIPGLVGNYLVTEEKMDPDLALIFKAVVRRSPKGERAFDIRIFDEAEAEVKKVIVEDYTTLDEHPFLTMYEGWYDEKSKYVELAVKKTVSWDVPILTQPEILKNIEALSEPGSTVFFYQARGSKSGGPLGRGAAVIELNPDYPRKGQKKYNVYMSDVDGMEPVGEWQKQWSSDKPKEIANWIKDSHHKRMY